MGGFFGAACKEDAVYDVFFGTDYHSHLGTRRGGMAAYDDEIGLQRDIHNIENSPFRTKFEKVFDEMKGKSAIGCISDSDPQPLLVRSNLGTYAICIVGVINNADDLIKQYLDFSGGQFNAMTGGKVNSTELVAALINQKSDFVAGIHFAQEVIDGTASILILKNDGAIIAARDRLGRIPVLVGKNENGYCVSFESFAYHQVVSDISRALKIMAKELNVPVVCLSQLSRGPEGRTDKRPMLSDLRESGAIEQDADVVLFLYRDEYYNPDTEDKNVAECIVSKNRHGEVGTVKLQWLPQYTTFADREWKHAD